MTCSPDNTLTRKQRIQMLLVKMKLALGATFMWQHSDGATRVAVQVQQTHVSAMEHQLMWELDPYHKGPDYGVTQLREKRWANDTLARWEDWLDHPQ